MWNICTTSLFLLIVGSECKHRPLQSDTVHQELHQEAGQEEQELTAGPTRNTIFIYHIMLRSMRLESYLFQVCVCLCDWCKIGKFLCLNYVWHVNSSEQTYMYTGVWEFPF